jgi:hypothetical protein
VSPDPPPSVWAVVKASAVNRLGRSLLIWYALLLGLGALVVLASLLAMRFGRQGCQCKRRVSRSATQAPGAVARCHQPSAN